MEKILIAFLCLAVIPVLGQVTVRFEEDVSNLFYRVGDKNKVFHVIIENVQNIVALTNQPPELVRKGQDDELVVLYKGSQAVEGPPSHYNFEMKDIEATTVRFFMEIFEVTEEDDAVFVIRMNEADPITETNSFRINLYRDMTLGMTFGENEIKAGVGSDHSFEVDAGTFTVTCTASGSNPAVENIVLYLNSEPIEASVETTKEAGSEDKYTSKITTDVNVEQGHNGKDISCSAQDPTKMGESVMQTVSATIKVNRYEPVVKCGEAQSYVGRLYAKVTCTVDHTGMDVNELRFIIEGKDESEDIVVYDGKNEGNYHVTSTTQGDMTEITLEVPRTEDWHFDSEFNLEVNVKGYRTKTPIAFKEMPGYGRSKDGGNGSIPVVASSFLTCLLACLLATLLQ